MLATSASSVTSPAIAIDCPPAELINATVASMPSLERSDTATRAPSLATASAVARPMPDPPPVTNATLPSSMPAMTTSLCLSSPISRGRVRHFGGNSDQDQARPVTKIRHPRIPDARINRGVVQYLDQPERQPDGRPQRT